jgi:gliding motility-associated-like protein
MDGYPRCKRAQFPRLPTAAGTYWYRLTVAENGNAGILACRIASNVNSVYVHDNPVISAGPDKTIVSGEQIVLRASNASDGNVQFSWLPPDHLDNDSILNPVASPNSNTRYTLSAVSAFGCRSQEQVLIKVVAGIFVPTAFTPDSDGKNDYWQIPFLNPAKGATVIVFNRNDQMVYQATGAVVSWEGRYNGPACWCLCLSYSLQGRNRR